MAQRGKPNHKDEGIFLVLSFFHKFGRMNVEALPLDLTPSHTNMCILQVTLLLVSYNRDISIAAAVVELHHPSQFAVVAELSLHFWTIV